MSEVLLLGAGPLPRADSLLTCSYNLRTAKLALWLQKEAIPFRLAAVDIFNAPGPAAETRPSLCGEYTLFSRDERGHAELAALIAGTAPRAIVAVSYEAAAMACEIEHGCPVWADMPGWIMTEAQLKAAGAGDDAFVEHFAARERAVLCRADVISVVSHNQRHATLGELAMLGRLGRRNIGHDLVRVLPSLAMDWQALLEARGEAAPDAFDVALPPDAFVVLWSGSYNLWSDAGRIAGLIRELLRAEPRLHFVSTGGHIPHHNDELYGGFLALVEGSEFRDRIHILPWQPFDRAVQWFGRANLGLCIDGVNLEIAYGSRTRVAEMLAHGLAVAANTGTELLNDLAGAGAVIALDPARPEAWAQAIEPYLRAPEKLRELASHGRRYIFERYALDEVGRELKAWLLEPQRAPDLIFLERVKAGGLKADDADGTAPPSAAMLEQPLVTWEPQAAIEAFARRALDPFTPSRKSMVIQKIAKAILTKRALRRPALAAWRLIARGLPAAPAGRWQSRFEKWLEPLRPSMSAAEASAIDGHARAVYADALRRPAPGDAARAINILLARREYDRLDGLACLPQRIEIEASSACNIRCRMCKLPYLQKPALHMSREIFSHIEPFLKYAATLEIIGEGEPTLNPALPEFLAAAARQGCHTRIFTNGTRLTPELSAAIVRARAGMLVISLCAGDRETYRQITGADLFEQVVENARDLREIKRMRGSAWPRLSMNAPMIAAALPTAPALVRLAAALGCEWISPGVAMIFRKEMESESLSQMDPREVDRIYAECEEAGRQAGIRVFFPSRESAVGEAGQRDARRNRFGCLNPWQSVRVRADGVVEVCTYNRKIIGDLNRSTLEEIWNGPEMRRFRTGEVRRNGVNDCENCYHCGYRAGAFKPAELLRYQQDWLGYD